METTTANLAGFIDEVLEVLRGMINEGYVPDNPDLSPAVWPYFSAYSDVGTTKWLAGGDVQTDLNNVVIAGVTPLDDLAKAVAYWLPFREQIPRQLIKKFIRGDYGDRSAHVQHPFTEIQFYMGRVEWPSGVEMYGILVTLVNGKIQNEV